MPSLGKIFVNDPQRPESFEFSIKIHQKLIQTYSELGFDIVELPLTTIENRVKFILGYIDKSTVKSDKLCNSMINF